MRTKTAFQLFLGIALLSIWVYSWILWKHHLFLYAALSLAGILILLHIFFIAAAVKKNNSVADIAWGLYFVIIAHSAFCLKTVREEVSLLQILVLLMVTLWGGRLALYIFFRNKGTSEDFRYAAMRKSFGNQPLANSYIKIFVMQGIWAFLIAAPVLMIMCLKETGFVLLDGLGMAVWLAGFLFETIADAQLTLFVRKEKNTAVM